MEEETKSEALTVVVEPTAANTITTTDLSHLDEQLTTLRLMLEDPRKYYTWLDERFEGIEKEIRHINSSFSDIDGAVMRVVTRIRERITDLEIKVEAMQRDIAQLKSPRSEDQQ